MRWITAASIMAARLTGRLHEMSQPWVWKGSLSDHMTCRLAQPLGESLPANLLHHLAVSSTKSRSITAPFLLQKSKSRWSIDTGGSHPKANVRKNLSFINKPERSSVAHSPQSQGIDHSSVSFGPPPLSLVSVSVIAVLGGDLGSDVGQHHAHDLRLGMIEKKLGSFQRIPCDAADLVDKNDPAHA